MCHRHIASPGGRYCYQGKFYFCLGVLFLNKKILYLTWLCAYILCAGLGMITERNILGNLILTAISLAFFIPGILLLYKGIRENDLKILKTVRIISIVSLVLTLSLIVLNILLVFAGEAAGQALNDLLILVSAPMFCCYLRGLSPFLWACLFISSFPGMWKK